MQPVVESLDDLQKRRLRDTIFRQSPWRLLLPHQSNGVARPTGAGDLFCNVVPAEVRGTLLWWTSAVWADFRYEDVHLAVDCCRLPISMLLTTPTRHESTRSCGRCSRTCATARL